MLTNSSSVAHPGRRAWGARRPGSRDQPRQRDHLRNALFNQILQALIELADAGTDERSILEALSNHIAARGGIQAPRQRRLQFGEAS